MRAWTRNKAEQRLVRQVRSTYTQAIAQPVQGMFNFRCHENSVEYLRTHPGQRLEVVEAIYVDDGTPYLHYLVRNMQTGELLEVTLGWRAVQLEYYVIRALQPHDHMAILSEFTRSLNYWTDLHVHPIAKKLFKLDRIV